MSTWIPDFRFVVRLFVAAALVGCALGCGKDRSPTTQNGRSDDRVAPNGANDAQSIAPTAKRTNTNEDPVLLIVGDSITAGYGLEKEQAYPALLQRRFDSAGVAVKVVNGGESGRTTSGGEASMDWYLKRRVDVLMIALGGNDALRAVSPKVVEKNLESMIGKARAKYPSVKIVIAGMRAPPQLGSDYVRDFENSFREVAQRRDAILIPFLLEGVAAEPSLNQGDGIHPTAEGQDVIASHLFATLAGLLKPN